MAQNKMQSQAGMPLSELIERFGIEAQCDAALEGARWPSRFICPERGESGALHVSRRRAPVPASTLVVERRRRSLWHPVPRLQAALTKWFQAISLFIQNKNNISAVSLWKRTCPCLVIVVNRAWESDIENEVQAVHARGEGRDHPAASLGRYDGVRAVRRARFEADGVLPSAEGVLRGRSVSARLGTKPPGQQPEAVFGRSRGAALA